MSEVKVERSGLTPWAREFACGCREVVEEGEGIGARDRCWFHDEPVVCGGYLIREETADDLLDAAKAAHRALAPARIKVLDEAIAKADGSTP